VENYLVSIITACLNDKDSIRNTIESVLNQTYKNIEFIVVDGGSTDGSQIILQEYFEKFSGHMKLISEPDSGLYFALNKGLKIATGKIIGIIGSGDYYELDAVYNIVNHMTNSDNEVLYGFIRVMHNNSEISIYRNNPSNLENQMIAFPSCFISRLLYCKEDGFNTTYKSSSDYYLLLRLFYDNNVKFIPVNNLISTFFTGGISSSYLGSEETLKILLQHKIISKKLFFLRQISLKIRKALIPRS